MSDHPDKKDLIAWAKYERRIFERFSQQTCDRMLAHVAELEAALKDSITAIDDWLNTYAAELCDEQRVMEARKRISQYGTIGYIAHVQEANRKALEQNHD